MITKSMRYPLNWGASHNAPDRIVLHAMGEVIKIDQSASDYFKTKKGKDIPVDLYPAPRWLEMDGTSAHRMVTPLGSQVLCRADNQGAWHAKGYNTNSLGVEFLVPGIHTYDTFLKAIKKDWLTTEAFDEGVLLVRDWMNSYSIEKDRVNTHQELSPERKYDPGTGFPLEDFLAEL